MKFPPKKFFLGYFYNTKIFVFEFQGESFGPFLSYRAHFRRYQHLEDIGSLLSARTVTVKVYGENQSFKLLDIIFKLLT